KVSEAPAGRIVTMELRVEKHSPNARKNLPYRVQCRDDTGTINLVFFHANKGWIEKQLPVGSTKIVSGKIEYYAGNPQIVHPDQIGDPEERAAIETVEPVYPLTAGITNKTVRKALHGALGFVTSLPEWLDEAYKSKNKFPDWDKAIEALHTPADEAIL